MMNFLRGRRVIRDYGPREPIEVRYCLDSARRCRETLDEYLDLAKSGRALSGWIIVLREAFIRFEQEGGPEGSRYVADTDLFMESLRELRESVLEGAGFVAAKAKAEPLSQYPSAPA